MKKVYLTLLSSIIILSIIYAYNAKYNVYVESYYEEVGFSEKGILVKSYNEIIEEKGKPNREVVLGEDKKEIYYPSYKIGLVENNGRYRLGYITIIDKNIRFGRGDIGIGSSRLQVLRAYLLKPRVKEIGNEEILGVIDGKYNVFFEFDEDKVISIKFRISDFH